MSVMQTEEQTTELTYYQREPDVVTLSSAYERTVSDLGPYFHLCERSYNDRHNKWPGKSDNFRKEGPKAFPWKGAADMEAHTISLILNQLVSLLMAAFQRGNVRAYPVNVTDMARAAEVSGFLRWMKSSDAIKGLRRSAELAANYFLERGIMVNYIGYQREDRRILQTVDFASIEAGNPQLGAMILDGTKAQTEELVAMLRVAFPNLSKARARRALKELRENGSTEIPTVSREVDGPEVKTLAPDGDFIFPSYTTDPQKAPYCFYRAFYTPQQLLMKAETDGWDRDWVDYCIRHFTGETPGDEIAGNMEGQTDETPAAEYTDLVEVIHAYQRLFDDEDGCEGIYETVFHPSFTGDQAVSGYAKFQLLNGYEDYPVVVTSLSDDSDRLYDTNTIPNLVRGIQRIIKVERDSRIDRNSMATMPPLLYRLGPQPPPEWGPGAKIAMRSKEDFMFGPAPDYNEGSLEMEQVQQRQANLLAGLEDDAFSQVRRQHITDKFLQHMAKVLKAAFKAYQRFGPEEVFFQVSGSADPVKFDKGDPNEDYDILIQFDVQNTDKEYQQNKFKQLVELTQLDRNGRIDIDVLLEQIAAGIDPVLADAVIQPGQQAQEKITNQITGDLAKIYAGMEVGARPNGAQLAMQIIQQYVQEPDIQQRLQQDEGFRKRLEKYYAQNQFQFQQYTVNAETGRVGTPAASIGNVRTQNMGQ